jgi:topoisomerase-4 subunit A
LGGLKVWFDPDVLRLNYDGRGNYLGEFVGNDLVLVILKNGEYYTSTYEATNHYDDNILRIEKFRPHHVFTAVLNDADQGYPYIKRFAFEPSAKKQRFLGENEKSTLIALSDEAGARFEVTFAAPDDFREPIIVDADSFISVKSLKAKGKRLTTYALGSVTEIEPNPEISQAQVDMETEADDNTVSEILEPDRSDQEVRDEIIGQERLFTDD